MADINKTRFSLARMMIAMLFASFVMAATFVRSDTVFAVCTLAVFALVAWHCVDTRMRPEAAGSLLGFTVPALMSLHILGETVAAAPPGEYVDTDHNMAIAVMTAVFIGGAGAWLGGLLGMIAGMAGAKRKQ